MPKESGSNRLTEKQKRFIDEYLIDLNATRAYKAAYPNVKNDNVACVTASQLLRKPNISAYIKKRIKDREQRTEITQDKVLKELAKIGFSNITDYVEIGNRAVIIKPTADIPEDKIGAIAGIKETNNGIEIKLNDKVKALELIGRHLGIFNDKIDLNHQGAVQIVDDIDD